MGPRGFGRLYSCFNNLRSHLINVASLNVISIITTDEFQKETMGTIQRS
jgi:hypothetical protein